MAYVKMLSNDEITEFETVAEAMRYFSHPYYRTLFLPSDINNSIHVCADTEKRTIIAEIVE